jgi:DNA ligase (NAD+)
MKKDREVELFQILQAAKQMYYNTGHSLLTDAQFDAIEDELRLLNPQHAYFSTVGNAEASGLKKEHRIPMLSADKCKNLAELAKWWQWLDLPVQTALVIEPKIDGLSATCTYVNGQLQYVATRGDGQIGQDISHIAPWVQTIPQQLHKPLTLEVRGELYLPKDTAFDTKGKPLRNNCVGLINRKEVSTDLQYVHFAAYQLAGDDLPTELDALQFIQQAGFRSVPVMTCYDMDDMASYYQRYLDELRQEWEYETDGLIIIVNDRQWHAVLDQRKVVDHHHHYLIAFKPPAVAKETTVLRVEWQVSRQGHLIPVANFSPIDIGGATIERASLHNAKTVETLHICEGDHLLVERANDVIPYVKENMTHHTDDRHIAMPLLCPSCQHSVEWVGVHLKCTNDTCAERQIQQILYWVRCCDMENIAEGTIRQLYKANLMTKVTDLYSITAQNLAGLEGFASKKIENFFTEIEKSRAMTTSQLISRLGIPLVQVKALQKLGIYSMDDFWQFDDTRYVIGQNMINWKQDHSNRALLTDLLTVLDIKDETVVQGNTQGVVCCTGSGPWPRQELWQKLSDMGYSVSDTLTKATTLLLCPDIEVSSSSKLTKAKKMGIAVQSYRQFFGQD